MAAQPALPTVVLVPGATSPTSVFTYLITLLRQSGFISVVALLPSSASRKTKASDPTDDAAAVRQTLLRPLIDTQKQTVVLAALGYGTLIASEAARGLDRSPRAGKDREGGVAGVIDLAALSALSDGTGTAESESGMCSLPADMTAGAVAALEGRELRPQWTSVDLEGRRICLCAGSDAFGPLEEVQAVAEREDAVGFDGAQLLFGEGTVRLVERLVERIKRLARESDDERIPML